MTAPAMSTIPEYKLPPVPFAREPTRVASYIPTQHTTAASVVYYRTTTAASAAATVAEGPPSPSNAGMDRGDRADQEDRPLGVGHLEALADYASFKQVVGPGDVRRVILKENDEILNGAGTGTEITGMLATSGIQAYAPGSPEARLLSILHGITLHRSGTSYAEPTGSSSTRPTTRSS